MKEVVGPFACDSHESQNVMNHSVVAFCNRSILCDSSFLQVYLRIGRVYQHLFFPVYLEACGPLKFSLFFDMRHDLAMCAPQVTVTVTCDCDCDCGCDSDICD